MTHSNQIFSPVRFGKFMRLYMGGNRRNLLLYAGGMAVLFIIVGLLTVCVDYLSCAQLYTQPVSADHLWEPSMSFFVVAFMTLACVAGSLMYRDMATPGKRLATIETPASQFEKFLSLFIIYVPCFMAAIIAAFWIGNATVTLCLHLFTSYGSETAVVTPRFFFNYLCNCEVIFDGEGYTSIVFAGFMLLLSVFALGSIVFHRFSFLKTACLMFGLQTVCVTVFSLVVRVFFTGPEFHIIKPESPVAFINGLSIASFLIAALLQWIAFARFKESETVSRW